MTEHVTGWLSAYSDGELLGDKLAQVEAHLPTCAVCQRELEHLDKLSSLLRQSPPMQPRATPEGFAEAVRGRLERPAGTPAWQKALKAGWWAVPLGLIALWAFALAVVNVSGALQGIRLLERISSAAPGQGYGLPALLRWAVGSLWGWISAPPAWVDLAGSLAQAFGANFAITAGLALLLWCWLAAWWASNPRRSLVKIIDQR